MRLERVYIDGYKNLKDFTINFDETKLTSVVIGQNGVGKSNLIEAIVEIFRYIDAAENKGRAKRNNIDFPSYSFEVDYVIDGRALSIVGRQSVLLINCDGEKLSRTEFDENREKYFPDLVFGYYSGEGRKLEKLFDYHQRRYYDLIKRNDNAQECSEALRKRRLFYVRSIHGILALFANFVFSNAKFKKLLSEKIGVKSFDSAMVLLKEPFWDNRSETKKLESAADIWGALGPAGKVTNRLKSVALHPITLQANAIDDYRDKQQNEVQFACYLKDAKTLKELKGAYKDDAELFYALEAADISDLIRTFFLWVKREDDKTGDVSFTDLSDGERQLLMVLGLLRVSRGKRALFLLDEPDTHLNPAWQHAYLELIKEWTGRATDAEDCHIIMTSHNPLTISALKREEVRVIHVDEDGSIGATPPYTDPRGLGFTSTLTEIFGLSTTLDSGTQKMIDERNELAHLKQRNNNQEAKLIELNDQLNRLGFMFESREPLYQEFLQAWKDIKYSNMPLLNPEQIATRQKAMADLIGQLSNDNGDVR